MPLWLAGPSKNDPGGYVAPLHAPGAKDLTSKRGWAAITVSFQRGRLRNPGCGLLYELAFAGLAPPGRDEKAVMRVIDRNMLICLNEEKRRGGGQPIVLMCGGRKRLFDVE